MGIVSTFIYRLWKLGTLVGICPGLDVLESIGIHRSCQSHALCSSNWGRNLDTRRPLFCDLYWIKGEITEDFWKLWLMKEPTLASRRLLSHGLSKMRMAGFIKMVTYDFYENKLLQWYWFPYFCRMAENLWHYIFLIIFCIMCNPLVSLTGHRGFGF